MKEKKLILDNNGFECSTTPITRKVPATLLEKVQEEINDINKARGLKIAELDHLDSSLSMLYQVRAALEREII